MRFLDGAVLIDDIGGLSRLQQRRQTRLVPAVGNTAQIDFVTGGELLPFLKQDLELVIRERLRLGRIEIPRVAASVDFDLDDVAGVAGRQRNAAHKQKQHSQQTTDYFFHPFSPFYLFVFRHFLLS